MQVEDERPSWPAAAGTGVAVLECPCRGVEGHGPCLDQALPRIVVGVPGVELLEHVFPLPLPLLRPQRLNRLPLPLLLSLLRGAWEPEALLLEPLLEPLLEELDEPPER